MDFVYFIVLVGVLIFVHELGHFAWAKFFGVKVLRFSLGFGPKLFGFRLGETEYRVAALPIGGYVKLLGESPHDQIAENDESRSFHAQPLWKRFLIVVAGPAMNLLFPVALFFVVYLGDTHLPPPVVGTVFPGRPADGRLLPGDRILAVDGEPMRTFYEVSRAISARPAEPVILTLERRGQQVEEEVTPVWTRRVRELERIEHVGRIGIMPHHPLPVIGVAASSCPAAAAGMRSFDVVVSARGQPVDRWLELERLFESSRGSMPLTYLRPVRVPRALGGLVEMDVYEPHIATLTPEPGRGSALLRSGLEAADLYVSHVISGSPEHRMGLLPGDRLVALNGRPVRLWATFLEEMRGGRGREHVLTWRRGDRLMEGTFRLRHESGVDEHGQAFDRYPVGIRNWIPMRVDPSVENPSPMRYAFAQALSRTGEMVEITVLTVVRLLQGKVTVKSIGGPITIYDVTGAAAREGTLSYLELMAFISINLGLINLLPIPLLDGGHLLFFLIEGLSRRPISARVRQYASVAGLSILILLMVLALKNDIERQWPLVADRVERE